MKKIKLICGDQEQLFEIKMAQRVLQIQKQMGREKKGWQLPDDSQYEFKDNALIKRTNTGADKKPQKPGEDKERDKT